MVSDMMRPLLGSDAAQREKRKLAALWLSLGVIVFIGMMPVIRVRGDDWNYGEELADLGRWAWLVKQMTSWSGRLFAEVVTSIFIPLPQMAWRFFNTLFIVLLVYSLMKLAFTRITVGNTLFAWLSVGIIAPSVLQMTFFWTIGSLYYVWPVALGMYSAIFLKDLYRGAEVSRTRIFLSLVAAFCGSTGTEQMGPIIFVFSALLLGVLYRRNHKISLPVLAYFLLTGIGLAIELFSPGIKFRVAKETATWYPEFPYLSKLQKLSRGIAWQFNAFSYYLLAIFFVLLIVVAFLVISKRSMGAHAEIVRGNTAVQISASVAAGAAVLALCGPGLGMTKLRVFMPMTHGQYDDLLHYLLWAIFWGAIIVSLVLLAKERWVVFLLFGASFMTAAILYASPTMYASGSRTMFVPSLVLLLILFKTVSENWDLLKRPVFGLIAIPAIINLINYYETVTPVFSNTYF